MIQNLSLEAVFYFKVVFDIHVKDFFVKSDVTWLDIELQTIGVEGESATYPTVTLSKDGEFCFNYIAHPPVILTRNNIFSHVCRIGRLFFTDKKACDANLIH